MPKGKFFSLLLAAVFSIAVFAADQKGSKTASRPAAGASEVTAKSAKKSPPAKTPSQPVILKDINDGVKKLQESVKSLKTVEKGTENLLNGIKEVSKAGEYSQVLDGIKTQLSGQGIIYSKLEEIEKKLPSNGQADGKTTGSFGDTLFSSLFCSLAVVVIVIVAGYVFYSKCVKGFVEDLDERLENIKKGLARLNLNNSQPPPGRVYPDQSLGLRELNAKADEISAKISYISSSDIAVAFEKCSNGVSTCSNNVTELKGAVTDILRMTPEIKAMNDRMQKLISGKPALVDLAVDTAVGLIEQCQSEGISTAAQLRQITAVAKEYERLGFEGLSQMAECKEYYNKRFEHEQERQENEKLQGEVGVLKTQKKAVTEERDQLKQTNETLSAAQTELEGRLATAETQRAGLAQTLQAICPDKVGADKLSSLLQNTPEELRAETLALVVQLYWFAQLSRNNPNKIKTAFTKFDETLYELFSDEQELLQSIRQTIQAFVNNEVFKGTSYEISWPLLNSSASEHEDCYNRENDEGNRICKVRSAVIINAGNVESVARIYTSL